MWVDAPVSDDDSWYVTLRDIHDYLAKEISWQVAVEIIDMSLFITPFHFPVEESHPIVPIWHKLVNNIIEDLNSPLWPSIFRVRCGLDLANSQVTIIITSKYASQLEQYKTHIVQIIRQNGLSGINVVFLEVHYLFSAGNDTDPETTSQSMSYATSESLYMRASVGIQGDPIRQWDTWQLIVLTCGSGKYNLGVTNFHVVPLEKLEQGIFVLSYSCH